MMAFNQQPTDAPISGDQFAQGAIDRITQQVRSGTYGEGRIGQAVNEFKNLDQLLQQGKISQGDYVAAGNKIRDFTQPILQQVMNGGSSAASAGQAAGAYDLAQKYYRNLDIYGSAKDVLGRDLTPTEFAQFAPAFGSGSQKEVEAGRGYLAQLAQQEKNSPQALDKKYQAGASQYGGQVGGLFKEMLGRDATPDEANHFGKMLASGEVDPYTLRQFMSQLPEYRDQQDAAATAKQTQADTAARGQLAGELGQYDQDFFNKAKENVISRYAQMGTQNSPSLDFALTNLMGDIQKQRSAYLADIARQDYTSARGNTRQDYLANKGLLRDDYTDTMNQNLANSNYARDRSNSLVDASQGRSYDIADYQTQRNDLLDMLGRQQQQRRSGGMGAALGPLLGAGIGALGAGAVSGGMGAGAGAQLGGYLGGAGGGAYDYLRY